VAETMQGQQVGVKDEGEPRSQPGGGSVVVLSAGAPGSLNKSTVVIPAEPYVLQLEEAEALVKYAADVGIDIDEEIRRSVFAARITALGGWTPDGANDLLTALTKLSARLKPVSGESLRTCAQDEVAATIKSYRRWAIALFAMIVPISVAAFVASATCEAIRKDIDLANGLAVTLVHDLSAAPRAPTSLPGDAPPPPGDIRSHDQNEVKDLQLFAATIRDIRARARRLSFFEPSRGPQHNENRYELPVPLVDFSGAAADAIKTYQGVRYFAQSTQESVSTTFGAVTSCILPALYALLGACAYLIRLFEGQIKARSFTGTDRPTAHFLIAGIGGLVVGLFGDFGAGHVLPPLALAFLVGYGVDVFFYFLDGLLQTFGRAQPKSQSAREQAPS
jgi:hypothetical protein